MSFFLVSCFTEWCVGQNTIACGQSYKGSTMVNYDSRVVPNLKNPFQSQPTKLTINNSKCWSLTKCAQENVYLP